MEWPGMAWDGIEWHRTAWDDIEWHRWLWMSWDGMGLQLIVIYNIELDIME